MKKKSKPLKKSKHTPKKGPIKREDFLPPKEAPEATEDIPVMESLEDLAEKEAETDFDDDLDSPDDRY